MVRCYLLDELLRSLSLGFGRIDGADKLTLRPHEVNNRSMIDIVAAALFVFNLVRVNFEALKRPPEILVIFSPSCEANDGAIEHLDILGYFLRSVPLGIH